MLHFIEKERAKDMFNRARYGEVGGVPQRAHAKASLSPEVPAIGWYSIK